jgi:MFS family permease
MSQANEHDYAADQVRCRSGSQATDQAQLLLTGPTGAGRGHAAGPRAAGRLLATSRTFGSLANRNYRLFAAGQVVSNTGSWMQRVAQDWLVLELTHGSGTALGITTGLQFLPMLASPWGGVVADRYPKRGILMITQALMGALAAILGILALTGAVRTWHVYLLALALGMVTAVDNPTRQAFAAEMVGKDAVANAIALNSAVFSLARIVGPAVAGLVISVAGTPSAFLINAASYGAVLVGLALMRPAELHAPPPTRRSRGQLRESVRYVSARPELWIPLVCVFFVSTFGMNFQVTNALMSREVFHAGAGAFGVVSAVYALGALGGALLAARRARPGPRLLLATAGAFGLLEVVTGLMPGFWWFLVMLVPTGLAVITFTTTANSATQLAAAAEMRGRVMGLYLLVFLGGAPLGSPLAGWIAEQFGPRMSMVSGGLISVAATAAAGIMLARRQGTEQHRRGDVVRRAGARQALAGHRHPGHRVESLGGDSASWPLVGREPGGHGVHRDAVRAEIAGERAGQAD